MTCTANIEVWRNKPTTYKQPTYYWQRKGIEIVIGDLGNLPIDTLRLLKNDISITAAELSDAVAVNVSRLEGLGKYHPSEAAAISLQSKRMLAKRRYILQVAYEAHAIIKRHNIKQEEAKKKKKLINTQQDRDMHDYAQEKITYFKRQVFFRLLAEKVGRELIDELEIACVLPAIDLFADWAKDHLPPEFAEHEIANQLKSLEAKKKP